MDLNVYSLEFEMSLVLIRHNIQLDCLPRVSDFLQPALDLQLLRSGAGNVADLFGVLIEAPFDDLFKRELFGLGIELATY